MWELVLLIPFFRVGRYWCIILRIGQGIDFVKTCETLNFEKHLDLKNI